MVNCGNLRRHRIARHPPPFFCRKALPLKAGGAQAVVAAHQGRSGHKGDEHAGDIAPHVLGRVLADVTVELRCATRKARPVMGFAVKRFDLR
jgi:hypothetical protein